MKYFFLLLLLLSGVAYGQSTYYIRADSTRLQKVGGNNELIIENGTRSKTGAYLKNGSNGRTVFYYAVDSASVSGSNLILWRGGGTQNITVGMSGTTYSAGYGLALTGTTFRLDSAAAALTFLRRKDSLTASFLNGYLTRTSLPTYQTNIYNSNGTLTGDRVVSLSTYKLGIGATPDAAFDLSVRTNIQGYSPMTATQYRPTEIKPTAISNSKFNAFGITTQNPTNGDMVIVYREGTSHASDNGIIKMRISINQGKDWSSATTVLSEAGVDLRNVTGGFTLNGRLVIFYYRYNTSGFPVGISYTYSDDGGTTWVTPIAFSTGSESDYSPYGQMTPIGDGKYLVSWYGFTGSTWTTYVTISSDNGKTWGSSIVVVTATASSQWSEASFVHIGGGQILGIDRANNGTVLTLLKSGDNGLTWTNQGGWTVDSWSSANSTPGWLTTFQGFNGRRMVACYYTNRTAHKMRVVVGAAKDLFDNGVTGWQANTRTDIDTSYTTDTGYPSAIHPYGLPYSIGWFYNGTGSSVKDITFFNWPLTNAPVLPTGNGTKAVRWDATLGFVLADTTVGGGGSSGWSLSGNAVTAGVDFLGSTNNTSLRFRTNNTQRAVLDSLGHLGVNTAAPTGILHLKATGNSYSDGLILEASASSDRVGMVNVAGATFIGYSSGGAYSDVATIGATGMEIFPNTGNSLKVTGVNNQYTAKFIGGSTSGQSYGPWIQAGTTSGDQALYITNKAGSTDFLTMLGNGKMKIGAGNPTEVLDVTGNFRLSGAFMPNNDAGVYPMRLTSNGPGAADTWEIAAGTVMASYDNTALTATTTNAINYTTPNDGFMTIYDIAAHITVTAVTGGVLTTTVSYTDETNTSRTITFFGMGLTSAGITTTGVSNYPPSGELVCYPNTAVTLTTTLTVGTATYNLSSSLRYIRKGAGT